MRRALLSALGIGFLPGLPGTYASAATAGACLLAAQAGTPLWLAAAVATLAGVVATLALAAPRGGADEGEDEADPPWVVTDEVAGQGLGVLGASGAASPLVAVAVSFVVFRVLDMAKPGPVGALERLPGAVGVLADDLAAGVGAALAALVAVRFGGL